MQAQKSKWAEAKPNPANVVKVLTGSSFAPCPASEAALAKPYKNQWATIHLLQGRWEVAHSPCSGFADGPTSLAATQLQAQVLPCLVGSPQQAPLQVMPYSVMLASLLVSTQAVLQVVPSMHVVSTVLLGCWGGVAMGTVAEPLGAPVWDLRQHWPPLADVAAAVAMLSMTSCASWLGSESAALPLWHC